MNGGLIGGILLMGYAIYTGYEAKTQELDWTPLLNAKVWGGGLVGLGSIIFNVKDSFKAYWESLPGLEEKVVKSKTIETKVKETIVEAKPPEVEELNISNLESQDAYCLSYLMKRAKKAKNEEALALLKNLHDKFYDIHSDEVKVDQV